MSSRRNVDILLKMVGYCDEIDETIELFGKSYETFASNKTYKNATAMCILQIGELAGHLSDDFRATYPGMPWQDMKGMRNVAAHRYGDIDLETLWGTITTNIPALREYCDTIISQYRVLHQDCVENLEQDEQ